jgi:hypothetical protein
MGSGEGDGAGESVHSRVDLSAEATPAGSEAIHSPGGGIFVGIEIAEIDAFGASDFSVGQPAQAVPVAGPGVAVGRGDEPQRLEPGENISVGRPLPKLSAEILPDFFHVDHDPNIPATRGRRNIRRKGRAVDCKLACHTRVP